MITVILTTTTIRMIMMIIIIIIITKVANSVKLPQACSHTFGTEPQTDREPNKIPPAPNGRSLKSHNNVFQPSDSYTELNTLTEVHTLSVSCWLRCSSGSCLTP